MTINFLYTNIGRGHPFYLDGILECLPESGLGSVDDIFSVSSLVPRMGWTLAQAIYKKASSHGGNNALYTRLRQSNDYNNPGLPLNIMGRDIKKRYLRDETPLVVAHPTLTGILKGKPNLLYQHGEVVAPHESLVTGKHFILVPTQDVADRFIKAGSPAKKIIVTGLCIECCLCEHAESMFKQRLQRIKDSASLCGGFFSSGAEPLPHIKTLITAADSLAENGGRSIIFAKKRGKLETLANQLLTKKSGNIECHTFTSRQEINALTAQHFGSFDFFAAPSHERTNWALGLGIPILILDPPIGTFSPLNRDVLLKRKVAQAISNREDATAFGKGCHTQTGRDELSSMARNGWGNEPINGFEMISTFLQESF